ncbi:flagellin N-terminal helical domain-containing protein [Neopusillimonas aestuarii]|uniref:flagellin N-terminal helical domain-containing protein n=1 Tax=Neopusillimonas aestuarii TaxID=2716226 RepID=UPI00197CFF4D|nr:flagellin [Pusillimonas sp. DMV24BSW_D]
MSVINTNYLSLVAQNNLQKSQSALGTAIERLSSGLRINSAKDDAAGQAIANRMGAQINGLTQAARNANDGISAAQTTEGALNQINDNLQRIRVLTVQAENGTNSDDDLTSIQNEIGQRLEEINRISSETEFNGVNVLAEDNTLRIQVGANDGQVIEVNLQKIDVASLSLEGFNVNGQGEIANEAATADDLTLAGFTQGATNANGSVTYTKDTNNDAATSDNLFAALADGDTVTYTGTDTGYGVAATANYTYDADTDSFSFDAANAGAAAVATALTPATGGTTEATVTIGGSSQDVLIDSNGNFTAADDGAVLYLDATGNLTKNNAGTDPAATATNVAAALAGAGGAGDTITVGNTTYTGDGAAIDVTGASISKDGLQNLADAANGATAYSVTLGADTYDVEIGGAVEDATNAVMYTDADGALTTDTTTTTTYFAQESGVVTDDAGAQVYVDGDGEFTLDSTTTGARTDNPLDVLDAALAQVDSLRSDLGAIQNRFESAITNLQTTSNNLSAAQSRIQDADYSVEVANMTRAQILQQAGTSVLAQANQIPQGVLSLLR